MRVGLCVLSVLLPAVAAERQASSVRALRGGSSSPLQLVNGAGELLASSATAVSGGAGGSSLSLVASVGGSARGRKLLNAVFGTSFPTALLLGAQDAESAGAWLASSPSMPGCLVLEAT